MFWEILKASKGLPVIDQYAALWGKKIAEADNWKVTEITGELPLIFLSDGSVLVDYRIYGTSAGAGVETESGEPHGYKLPLTVESGVTENLWNLDSSWTNGQTDTRTYLQLRLMQYNGSTLISSTNLNVGANGHYTIQSSLADANYTHIYLRHNGSVKDLPIGTIYGDFKKDKRYIISLDVLGYDPTIVGGIKLENIMLTEGSTPPDHYIPHRYTSDISIYIGDTKLGEGEYVEYREQKIYKDVAGTLTPTEPPVPLPPIPTYKGENTLSSAETLGEVTVKGRIKEVDS